MLAATDSPGLAVRGRSIFSRRLRVTRQTVAARFLKARQRNQNLCLDRN